MALEHLQSIWFCTEVEDDEAQKLFDTYHQKTNDHNEAGSTMRQVEGRKPYENQIHKINDRPESGRNFIWINYLIEFNRNIMHLFYGDSRILFHPEFSHSHPIFPSLSLSLILHLSSICLKNYTEIAESFSYVNRQKSIWQSIKYSVIGSNSRWEFHSTVYQMFGKN